MAITQVNKQDKLSGRKTGKQTGREINKKLTHKNKQKTGRQAHAGAAK